MEASRELDGDRPLRRDAERNRQRILRAAGLPELITENQQDYEDLAVRLATQPEAIAAIKAKLTRNCPLFDTDLFRRNIETAYLRMREIFLAGERPRAFDVSSVVQSI